MATHSLDHYVCIHSCSETWPHGYYKGSHTYPGSKILLGDDGIDNYSRLQFLYGLSLWIHQKRHRAFIDDIQSIVNILSQPTLHTLYGLCPFIDYICKGYSTSDYSRIWYFKGDTMVSGIMKSDDGSCSQVPGAPYDYKSSSPLGMGKKVSMIETGKHLRRSGQGNLFRCLLPQIHTHGAEDPHVIAPDPLS